LWKTIIKSNPEFSKSRLLYLSKDFEMTNSFEPQTISAALTKVSRFSDPFGEFFQFGFTPKELYYMFLYELYGKELKVNDRQLTTLYNETLELFLLNPPSLIDSNFGLILNSIRDEYNCGLNILSNTSFAGAEHLIGTLKYHNIYDLFDFCMFSETYKMFKPNINFFQKVIDNSKCQAHEILHAGDNYDADVVGADNAGMSTMLFTYEQPNYSQIFNYLT
jgi:FMN phosphatase YigB (HAD superfamily)